MITLHQLPGAFGLPVSVSPFCTKLEAYFRLANYDYRIAEGIPLKSPSRKVPFVTLSNGRVVTDSGDIIAELEWDGPRLDKGLTRQDRERAGDLQALAEGPVYFACLYSRFVEAQGWKNQKEVLRSLLPGLLAPVLMPVIRRSQRKACAKNGFTDRSSYGVALSAIDSLGEALGDRPFMLGEQPRSADCSAWASLLHTAYTASDNPARHAVRKNASLMDYIDRVANLANFRLPERPISP